MGGDESEEEDGSAVGNGPVRSPSTNAVLGSGSSHTLFRDKGKGANGAVFGKRAGWDGGGYIELSVQPWLVTELVRALLLMAAAACFAV